VVAVVVAVTVAVRVVMAMLVASQPMYVRRLEAAARVL
jgi:hypothetical protein